MARGRKEALGKTFSIRLHDDVREELERAADARGWTLNEEIRKRLSDSFEHEKKVEEKYGDRRTAAFFRMLSLPVMLNIYGEPRRKPWLEDRYQYIQVATAIKAMLGAFEPTGPTQPKGAVAPEMIGLMNAGLVLSGIRHAAEQIPEWWPSDMKDAFMPSSHAEMNIHDDLKAYFDRIPDDLSQSRMFRREFERKQS